MVALANCSTVSQFPGRHSQLVDSESHIQIGFVHDSIRVVFASRLYQNAVQTRIYESTAIFIIHLLIDNKCLQHSCFNYRNDKRNAVSLHETCYYGLAIPRNYNFCSCASIFSGMETVGTICNCCKVEKHDKVILFNMTVLAPNFAHFLGIEY